MTFLMIIALRRRYYDVRCWSSSSTNYFWWSNQEGKHRQIKNLLYQLSSFSSWVWMADTTRINTNNPLTLSKNQAFKERQRKCPCRLSSPLPNLYHLHYINGLKLQVIGNIFISFISLESIANEYFILFNRSRNTEVMELVFKVN